MGLAATLAWLALGGGVVGNVDFIALATLFTAVVGASLAWYLPQAAASRRYDPMAEALNARIAMLGAAALDRFGKADLAGQWLARPHPSLDNRTPRDAAKRSLPDSHTDFVFAVAAEEFGIILCLVLLALFAFVVIRALSRAYATEDMFARFAASGLAILFGVQAAINMSVNLQLIPAKGMTLPFISYGGSSIISLAYGVGMLLAVTRLRPRTEMESIGDANSLRSYA